MTDVHPAVEEPSTEEFLRQRKESGERGLIPVVMVPDDAAIDALHERVDDQRAWADLERTVRRALVARNGLEVGNDAAAEALVWAWQRRDRVMEMSNPAGYLYRVGQTAARRQRRFRLREARLVVEPLAHDDVDAFDAQLFEALTRLRRDQRVAVVLVHCYAYSYREVAALLGVGEAAVTNHVHRGLARLRSLLGDR